MLGKKWNGSSPTYTKIWMEKRHLLIRTILDTSHALTYYDIESKEKQGNYNYHTPHNSALTHAYTILPQISSLQDGKEHLPLEETFTTLVPDIDSMFIRVPRQQFVP